MVRRTRVRPSDVYPLPSQPTAASHRSAVPATVPDEAEGDPAEPGPPRGHRPWAVVAAVLAAVVVGVAGLVGAGQRSGQAGGGPTVDVVSEDQAIAALALFEAQVSATGILREQSDPFAPPGPAEHAATLHEAADRVATHLEQARAQPDADHLAAAYWEDAGHDRFEAELRELATETEGVALLAMTHDTVYGGAGAIDPAEARHALANRYGQGGAGPTQAWSQALLAQLDGADAAAPATAARAETGAHWAARAEQLDPPAVGALRTYLGGLPPETLDALGGHPVAGPAIDRLS
jgi:hypothetical protein